MKSSQRSARHLVASDRSFFRWGDSRTLSENGIPRQQQSLLKHDADIGPRPAEISPSTFTVPDVTEVRPARMRSNVVFPHPLGPTTETNSFSLMSRLTFRERSHDLARVGGEFLFDILDRDQPAARNRRPIGLCDGRRQHAYVSFVLVKWARPCGARYRMCRSLLKRF